MIPTKPMLIKLYPRFSHLRLPVEIKVIERAPDVFLADEDVPLFPRALRERDRQRRGEGHRRIQQCHRKMNENPKKVESKKHGKILDNAEQPSKAYGTSLKTR